jgi:hypothetical protein
MYETFRPRSNFAWAGFSILLICLFAVNSFAVNDSALKISFELFICAVLIAIASAVWIKPKLVFRDHALEVVNPLKTQLIAYKDVLELETQWALRIIHTGGTTTVWVAPASGKRRWIAEQRFGMLGRNVPLSESRHNQSETMSGSLDSFSGQAAYMIRERIKRLH